MYDGTGKILALSIYPIKYLNDPLFPYECLLDNTILLISTSLVLIGFPFLWKAFLLTQSRLFVPVLYHAKKKRHKLFMLIF